MEVINKHRKELIVLGVIIEIILVPLIFKNVNELKNKDNNGNNISNVNEIGKQEFGIMYRDNDTDQYKSYSGSIVDAINNRYVLNVGNSKCSDGSGATVTPSSVLSISGSTVTIKSNKTVYCTLYFDKKKTITALDIVASKPKSLSPQDNQGGMYRYQGTSTLVNNNYICFGTDNKTTCTSDEDHYMYRIIGITSSGEMKLIKETPVKEGDNTIFAWFYHNLNTKGKEIYIDNKWPDSAIYKRLNGLSNGTITGTGSSDSYYGTDNNINANTNIFVDGYINEYPYMKKTSTWYGKISDHDWIYGNSSEIFSSSQIGCNGHNVYKIMMGQLETKYTYMDSAKGYYVEGTYKWNPETDKVQAKMGLPYIHDFLFMYYDGSDSNSRGIPGSDDLSSVWFYVPDGVIYTMTTAPAGPNFSQVIPVIRCISNGRLIESLSTSSSALYGQGMLSFPTFYVTNTAEMEGSGLETDPYRIIN